MKSAIGTWRTPAIYRPSSWIWLRDELVTLLCMLATEMLALGDDRLAE